MECLAKTCEQLLTCLQTCQLSTRSAHVYSLCTGYHNAMTDNNGRVTMANLYIGAISRHPVSNRLVVIMNGAYERNGLLSNYWDWIYLDDESRGKGYGWEFEVLTIDIEDICKACALYSLEITRSMIRRLGLGQDMSYSVCHDAMFSAWMWSKRDVRS